MILSMSIDGVFSCKVTILEPVMEKPLYVWGTSYNSENTEMGDRAGNIVRRQNREMERFYNF